MRIMRREYRSLRDQYDVQCDMLKRVPEFRIQLAQKTEEVLELKAKFRDDKFQLLDRVQAAENELFVTQALVEAKEQ